MLAVSGCSHLGSAAVGYCAEFSKIFGRPEDWRNKTVKTPVKVGVLKSAAQGGRCDKTVSLHPVACV